ncbi:MAG: AAA family ATPase [Rhodothermales bacterium]
MRLSRIEISGFRGVRDAIDLRLPSGFTVISGRNGSGKSTFCDAIEYVFTGDIRRESDYSENQEGYADYIRWQGEGAPSDGTFVRLYVRDDDRREIVLEREFEKPLVVRRSVGGDGAPDNEFESASAEEEVVSWLCDPGQAPDSPLRRLCETSIIRDERITDLSVEAGERDRYKFVRRALGMDVFADSMERTKKVCDKLKEKVRDLEPRLERHEIEVNRLQSEIDAARDEAEDIESVEISVAFVKDQLAKADRLDADEEISTTELATRARKLVIDLREQANELAHALSDFNELRNRIERYREGGETAQRLKKLSGEIEELQSRIKQVEARKKALEAELEAFQKRQPDSANLAELHRLGEEIGLTEVGECPLCGESPTPEEFEASLRRLRSTVDDIIDRIDNLNGQIDQQTEQLNPLRSQKEELVKERDEVRDQRATLISQLNAVRERADDVLEDRKEDAGQVDEKPATDNQNAQQEVPDLDSGKLEREINERRRLRTQLDEKVSDVEASLALKKIENLQARLDEERQKREETQEELRYTRERHEQADKVRQRVKSEAGQVHKDRIRKLAPLLTELYSRLRPHVDWMNLETKVRGNIQLYLRFDVDGKNPSLFFSSGQRRAVGLAFLLAVHLGCTWSRFNTLILDDPVQHIDDFRALQLTELLSAIRRSGRQIIVTIEDEALARLLRRRLRSSDAEEGQHVQMVYDARSGARISKQTVIGSMPERVLAGVG